jgi:hypothetical protein
MLLNVTEEDQEERQYYNFVSQVETQSSKILITDTAG